MRNLELQLKIIRRTEAGRIPQLYILHLFKGKYQSGQMGQTVNLLAYAFGGSNPSLPTKNCGSSSVDRALAFQAEGRGFEPRLPLFFLAVIAQW